MLELGAVVDVVQETAELERRLRESEQEKQAITDQLLSEQARTAEREQQQIRKRVSVSCELCCVRSSVACRRQDC